MEKDKESYSDSNYFISHSSSSSTIPKWHLKVEHVDPCSCNHVCPCSFTGIPSNGFCRGLGLHHVINGNFGEIILDNLDLVYAYSFPNAIFQGNGTAQLYITKNADNYQRDALIKIFSGKAGGDRYFAFLPKIIKYFLEPQFVNINVNMNEKKSSFSIDNILEAVCESFVDPVTKEEQNISVHKPMGKIWKIAEFANSKILRISTAILNFNHSNTHAEYAIMEFSGP